MDEFSYDLSLQHFCCDDRVYHIACASSNSNKPVLPCTSDFSTENPVIANAASLTVLDDLEGKTVNEHNTPQVNVERCR